MLKRAPPLWMLVYLLLCAALSWSLDWPAIPGPPLPPLGIALVVLAFIPTAQQQDANENDSFGLLTWPLPERSQSRGGEHFPLFPQVTAVSSVAPCSASVAPRFSASDPPSFGGQGKP